jgi:hypothetical protein
MHTDNSKHPKHRLRRSRGRISLLRGTAFYLLAWLLLTTAQVARGASPARYYVWTGLAEWAGLLLVAALVGWFLQRRRLTAAAGDAAAGNLWFMAAQALLMTAVASLAGWMMIDFSFDGLGADAALFGLAGRACACSAALMLLGTSIVMAWQSTAAWRTAFQFAALAAGVLLTTSIGMARIDARAAAPWAERTQSLLVSTGMMAVMTRFGLSRALPPTSDWIRRGRQASPVFAAATLLLLAIVLVEKLPAGP